ncbi:ATP-binding protein [Cystobacter ferrugineus]|uniref:AAA family ATPase n=1 Tax=Cystobacter ferrugineus TaxID=83449 RepID=A0A1L9B488_9BACT|nr:AAA family ATPase [Cystobacter ferrugineus]OJH37079.1 AAA family ATPase [Cystobacter ferrugineus]
MSSGEGVQDGWMARVLGLARLESPEGSQVRLERRAAAMLAYVGLEGPSPKFTVASLLWPDSPPTTIRANMRQLLRRLRLLCDGVELVEATSESLTLVPWLWLDVAQLKAAAEAHSHSRVLEIVRSAGSGSLLSGLELEDCDELSRWLDGARTAVEGWVRAARQQGVTQAMARGDWNTASALVHAWLQQEPESEQAGRHLIQLHYLQGDRDAALAAFERLRETLSRELDVDPMPETLALVRQIEKGTAVRPPSPAAPGAPLPLSVRRPPMLAGREAAWRELEEGFATGQLVFISGEPGVGKSRLVEEFAASKGRWVKIEGRFGDQAIPFAAQARAFRIHMSHRPEVILPDWVRTELSRILPELGGTRPPPLASEADELRFYDANAEAMRLLMDGYRVVVTDDVQYWDSASAKVFTYAFERILDSSTDKALAPRFIDCYRRGELPPYSANSVRQLVDTGRARLIELGPLSEEQVRLLLASLELPGAEAHADALARYTGGNPLYILETLKHLIETDGLRKDWPHRLPPPGRVGPLLQRRLERLSPRALQSAQLAALAGPFFRTSFVPEVLELSATESLAALAELEATQILVGERFSHDLVEEAIRASVSPVAARALHARLAVVLERSRAPALILAHHWREAGELERALSIQPEPL